MSQLLVFDWDGTLMDSESRIVASALAAARDLEGPRPTATQVRDIIGLGLPEAVRTLYPQATPAFHAAFMERYRHYFLEADPTPMPLFPGVPETLAELEAAGYLLAVATGKSRRGLERALDDVGLRQRFVATRCADESFSKPHPGMLLEILEATGCTAAHTVMIGDTEYDLGMARNAGVRSVAVAYGVHACERLLEFGPLGCIHSFAELPALLAAHGGSTTDGDTP